MAQYEITQADAATAVRAFDENAADIKAAMNAGYSTCQQALSRYKGAQADMFWRTLSDIGTEMSNISRELDRQGQLVHQASRAYLSGDEDAASLLNVGGAASGGSISAALG